MFTGDNHKRPVEGGIELVEGFRKAVRLGENEEMFVLIERKSLTENWSCASGASAAKVTLTYMAVSVAEFLEKLLRRPMDKLSKRDTDLVTKHLRGLRLKVGARVFLLFCFLTDWLPGEIEKERP